MKNILTIFFTFISYIVLGQNSFAPVDRLKVEATVKDSVGENYYPSLMMRYNQFDTSLTKEQYRLLYYGFAFQKDYNGYSDHKKKEIIQLVKTRIDYFEILE